MARKGWGHSRAPESFCGPLSTWSQRFARVELPVSHLNSEYETVYTMTDFYDGPRGGIAAFRGRPHVYKSDWDESADEYGELFRLSPISDEVLALALEDWEIWLRWQRAFHDGKATTETHPALPEDRARHNQLQQALKGKLAIDEQNFVRARGVFRRREQHSQPKLGWQPLEVMWSAASDDDVRT